MDKSLCYVLTIGDAILRFVDHQLPKPILCHPLQTENHEQPYSVGDGLCVYPKH
jgi:hypothetical protein